jgi:hypothetical protein
MTVHRWDIETLHAAKMSKQRPKNYNGVKQVVDGIKELMRKETDPEILHEMASAGMIMNKILLK